MFQITLYTDGSCLGNPGPGDYAAVLNCNGRAKEITGSADHTTNNRMELQAVIVGLQALTCHCRITVVTDSQYEDQMCLDIQSLINLHPFFQPEHLLAWPGMESALFLSGIKNGRLESIFNRLYDAESVSDLDSLADWHVGEYIASSGSLMWFAGMVKAVARQHLNRLGSRAGKFRAPAPGGRYYIFPAAVGDRDVPKGHIEPDPDCATAWVNDNDWLTYIVDILGGCDWDDALWVFPFVDMDDGRKQKILIWRSPNQLGEYVVLEPTANSHTIEWDIPNGVLSYPKMQNGQNVGEGQRSGRAGQGR